MKSPWPRKKLGEICEKIKKEKAPVGTLPYIEIGNINIESKKINFTDKGAVKGSVFCPENSILISRVRPTRGAVTLIDRKIAVSSAFTIIKPKTDIIPKLLFYFLAWNKKFFDYLGSKQKGTNYPSVKESEILDFEISFPQDLEIQQKIVSILDTIQSAIEIQNKIIETTKELKKSMMADLFKYGGPSFRKGRKLKKTEIGEIPEDWEVVRLGEICERKLRNIFPKDFPNEEFEYYSIPNFHERKQPVLVLGKEVGSSKRLVTPGIVLFGKLNPKLPKIWIVNNYFPGHRKIATTEFLPLMCGNKISPFFLYYLLWSDYVLPLTFEMASGSTTSRQRINPNLFYELKIPLPPLPEQHEIADILQTIDKKIEIEKKKKELYEELFKTMLNKLMNGEIDVEKIEI